MARTTSNTSSTDENAYDSIRYKTYTNVIETITCLGYKHLMIKTVTTGDVYEIDLEKNSLFPLFHIAPTSVVFGEHSLTYNFQLFIMDLVEPHQSNETEVLSDTLQIMKDIIAQFKHGEILWHYNTAHGQNARYWIEGDLTVSPFTERFENSVTGWVTDLSIIVEEVYETCNAPIDTSSDCIQ